MAISEHVIRRSLHGWPGLRAYDLREDLNRGVVEVHVTGVSDGYDSVALQDHLDQIRPAGIKLNVVWAVHEAPVIIEHSGPSDEELREQLIKLRRG